MIDSSSRYYHLRNKIYKNKQGEKIAYKSRRLLPLPNLKDVTMSVSLVTGERLDLLAARWLGDPLQYWQICDANPTILNPVELVKVGEKIQLPLGTDDNSVKG